MADSFRDLLIDLFQPVGDVSFRRMFSGSGIFRDGLMFALVVKETLYFKTDEATVADFEAEGSRPFTFTTRGELRATSYWSAPERLYDEPDEFRDWALAAFAVAERAKAEKPKKKARKKPGKA